jgi:uncharacterized protein YecE (DUF72 family)
MSRQVTSFGRVEGLDVFMKGVRSLGESLGPVRVKVPQARDDGFLRLFLDSLDPDIQVALDFRHPSWEAPEVDAALDDRDTVRVGSLTGAARLRYIRLREGPYSEDDLTAWADRLRPVLDDGADVYCFFRHEDEPTAPDYATRLLTLLR